MPPSLDPKRAMADAWKAFQSGEHERAEGLLREVIKANPRHVPALVASGMALAASGRQFEAIDRLREALRLDKNCVPALKWMCLLLVETQQSAAAIEFGDRAVALSPNAAEPLHLLGSAYFWQKRYVEAVSCYDRAIRLAPNQAALHFGKAEVLEKLTRQTAAVDELVIATRLAPTLDGLVRLARLQLYIGRVEDAVFTGEKALNAGPDAASAHVVTARALTEAGNRDQAELHWDRARSLEPYSALVSLEKARSLSSLGLFDQAMIEFLRVIELDDREGQAYYSIVSSKRVTEQDRPLIEKMEGLLADPDLPVDSQISLQYALGKSYDDLREYQTAIPHFDEANRLEYETHMTPFDRDQFATYVDGQIKVFTPELFHQSKQAGLGSALPVFVVGMMRSGTTLLEQVLTCHSQVGGSGEQAFWNDNASSVIDAKRGTVNGSLTAKLGQEYLDLLQRLAPGAPMVVDKNPGNIMVVGAIHLAFPNAKIVHVRRNPVDTALSIWMTPMQTSAGFVCVRENIVFAYREYLRLMEHWRSVVPGSNFLDVEYESLIQDPETEIRRITEFLGLDWEEACLHPESNPQAVRTPSFWQVRQPFYKSSTERRRRYEPWLGPFRDLAAL
jgi:tetratricopeptide (TPR) repeat protein